MGEPQKTAGAVGCVVPALQSSVNTHPCPQPQARKQGMLHDLDI